VSLFIKIILRQFFAIFLAAAWNYDPDNPWALRKATEICWGLIEFN